MENKKLSASLIIFFLGLTGFLTARTLPTKNSGIPVRHISPRYGFSLIIPPGWDISDRESLIMAGSETGDVLLSLFSPGSIKDEYGMQVDREGRTVIDGAVVYIRVFNPASPTVNKDPLYYFKDAQSITKKITGNGMVYVIDAFWDSSGRVNLDPLEQILSSFRLPSHS